MTYDAHCDGGHNVMLFECHNTIRKISVVLQDL